MKTFISFIYFVLLIGLLSYYFYFIWYTFFYLPKPKHSTVFLDGWKDRNSSKEVSFDIITLRKDLYIFIPKIRDLEKAPVILLLHGIGSPIKKTDYDVYQPLIEHEVSQGRIVIFPIYQRDFFHPFSPHKFLLNAKNLTNQAIREVKEYIPKNNLSNFVIMGFSMGGAVATHLASIIDISPKNIILINPGETFPLIPVSLYGLPFAEIKSSSHSETSLLVLFGKSDHMVSYTKNTRIISRRFRGTRKYGYLIPSDNHGLPVVWANHLAPILPNNPAGVRGYWKLIDAAINCSFSGQDCDILRGENEKAFEMGRWSDGVSVMRIKRIF